MPVIFAQPERTPESWVGVAKALAAGFMIAASALLIYEGAHGSLLRMAAGTLVGALFLRLGVESAGWTEGRPFRGARPHRWPVGRSWSLA